MLRPAIVRANVSQIVTSAPEAVNDVRARRRIEPFESKATNAGGKCPPLGVPTRSLPGEHRAKVAVRYERAVPLVILKDEACARSYGKAISA